MVASLLVPVEVDRHQNHAFGRDHVPDELDSRVLVIIPDIESAGQAQQEFMAIQITVWDLMVVSDYPKRDPDLVSGFARAPGDRPVW
ncbi:hypothetical protein ACVW1B_000128 [Bradyrhizobium sp. USDA 4502]